MSKFTKSERLNNKSTIDDLFSSGKVVASKSLKIIWKSSIVIEEPNLQVMISVPKKNIKLAVNRNLIKRRIKEAFRVNKKTLYSSLEAINKTLILAIIYQKKEIDSYVSIEQKINLLLARLLKQL